MSQNILVTGGAGLIGSHLCEKLLKENYKVYCVDNFITGQRKNLDELYLNPNFIFIEADVIGRPEGYLLDNFKFDYIFHLASPASPVGYQKNPIATYLVNSLGTHNLLELAKNMNSRFLFTSTSEVYGDPLVHPQVESYWGNVNPNGPRSCYDESKRFGEMVCKTFEREFSLDVRIVRIFNTYGPKNDPHDGRVVPNLITQALKNEAMTVYGDGSQTRSFCYVTDLVEGIYSMMFSDSGKNEVINLGNPDEYKIIDMANIIKELTQSSSEIIFKDLPTDDPKHRCPDITKAKKILNWEPKFNFREGLIPTIEYFRQNLI